MSLTSFLKHSADVRERFKSEFIMPPFDATKELAAPPLTKNHSLVGTAFDYLLRFHIERLNPKSKTRKWIAEEAVLDYDTRKFHQILAKAKNHYNGYLSNGKVDAKLLRTVLYLAQLDVLYRTADDSYYYTVGKVDRKDVQDLRQLLSLVQPKIFRAKKACALNPTFGRASELVGGADCDLVIDDTLIEIKTTKDLKVRREYFDQLIGYYVLFRIGGIDGLAKEHSIETLGIYFPRHGHLWLFKVGDVIDEKRFSKFVNWFRKRARRVYRQ